MTALTAAPSSVTGATLEIDVNRSAVIVNGAPFPVTPRELALLRALAVDPTRMVPRAELMRTVWGYSLPDGKRTRTLDSTACRLRARLRVHGGNFIVSAWAQGYRLVDPGREHTVHVSGLSTDVAAALNSDPLEQATALLERATALLWQATRQRQAAAR